MTNDNKRQVNNLQLCMRLFHTFLHRSVLCFENPYAIWPNWTKEPLHDYPFPKNQSCTAPNLPTYCAIVISRNDHQS